MGEFMDEIEISEDILKKCILDSENLLSSIRVEIHQVKPFPNFCMVWYEVFDNSKSSKFMGRVDKGDYMDLLKQTKISEKMTYEEWYDKNEEEILIELAETGADREMDFNSEVEFDNRYEDYLNQNNDE